MTATTSSGWSVLEPGSTKLVTLEQSGIKFVVRKELAVPFRRLIRFLNAVEPVTETGWDGGYAHRKIAGTDVWSDHAGGAAIDWNASQHGRTGNPSEGWTRQQVALIKWYIGNSAHGDYLDWGGLWKHPDPMHFAFKPEK